MKPNTASLLFGLAPDPAVLVLARVLQVGGAALMFPQTLTGIQLNFDDDDRAARSVSTPSHVAVGLARLCQCVAHRVDDADETPALA